MNYEKTVKLFLVFGSIYGNLWQRQLDDNRMSSLMTKIWACEIENMDMCEIEFGLKKCIKKLEFPPTLPQFVQKCQIEPKDIEIENDWRISFSHKDKTYEQVHKSISLHDRSKPWWDYEKVFKAKYEKYVEEHLKLANENPNLKADIIHRLIGDKKQFLLTAN